MLKAVKITSIVGFSVLMLSACSVSISSASLGDIKLCDTTNSEGMCEEHSTSFPAATQTVNATVILNNAPADTIVRSEWWQQIDPPNKIDEVTYTTKENENAIFFSLTSAGNGFPPGEYEFHAFLNSETEPKVVKYTFE